MRQGIAWLYQELPRLVERGVLTSEAADALRRHYGPLDGAESRAGWGQILLASFGALLVGGGIILILAHNWDGLDRPARAAIALGALLLPQALTIYAVARRPASAPWREATSGLLVAGVGAAIALIGQTYHVGGSFEGLMRAWLWLVVLIPYLTGSTLAAIMFWGLLVVRVLNLSWRESPPDPWMLALVAAPFVFMRLRRAPESWATALVMIAATASVFVVGSVATLRDGWTNLWAVFEVSLVAAVVAFASWPIGAEVREAWRDRVGVPAWLALIVLGTILTFDDLWRVVSVGDGDVRDPSLIVSFAVSVVCAAFATVLAIRLAQANRFAAATASAAALLVVVMHVLSMFSMGEGGWIVFNVWLLALGITTVVEGLRTLTLGMTNRGLLALAALIAARFFDTELSFLARGLVFVAFGMACFSLNLWLMRRMRKRSV
jgi:uncharacterized membrane protein